MSRGQEELEVKCPPTSGSGQLQPKKADGLEVGLEILRRSLLPLQLVVKSPSVVERAAG